jgi:L1 cell adhesion molecule like protein
LIYDFGGGTFDVAVLEINRGNIDIKAVGGDNHLGGDDFDTNILKYCLEQFYLKTGIYVPNNTNEGQKALRRLRTRCEEQKCKLSSADSTTISVDAFFDAEDISIILTRDKFEELNEDLFIKSMDIVQQTLEDKNMEASDIDDIVLVGGSTRIPRIQEMLTDMFNKPLNHSVNPDEAVAVGAAIQAAILNGNQAQGLGHLKVSDVAPMSLGVKVVGGFMSIIIHRNSKVPNKYTKQYETSGDYQTTVDVEIYEGEEEMAQNNRLLGKFVLSGIPSAPKGEQLINVTFEINDEGILHVNAKIVSTGGEEEIEIKEHKGRLTDKELEDLIRQV